MYKIIVSLNKRQLHLLKDDQVIKTYPVGVGNMVTPSPPGHFTIMNKVPYPGVLYGAMWMGLSLPHYGIHGTNAPWTIGKRVSAGCIRMHNKDVLELSQTVPIGTSVIIRND